MKTYFLIAWMFCIGFSLFNLFQDDVQEATFWAVIAVSNQLVFYKEEDNG